MHTTIVDKITDMMCDAVGPYFTVTTEIQNAIYVIVEGCYNCDATCWSRIWRAQLQVTSGGQKTIRSPLLVSTLVVLPVPIKE